MAGFGDGVANFGGVDEASRVCERLSLVVAYSTERGRGEYVCVEVGVEWKGYNECASLATHATRGNLRIDRPVA